MDALTALVAQLKKRNISKAEEKAKKMNQLMELVLERNEIINLTAITEREEFVEKHLMDSICCYGWDEMENAKRIADVGTGAGFPGLPLALLYPQKEFILMDSLGKRIEFINEALEILSIENVKTDHIRAEDSGRSAAYRETFDLCVSRAVAGLSVLMEYCLPLVRVGGWFYAYKTGKAVSEIESSLTARDLLGGDRSVEVRPVNSDQITEYGRNIMAIKKIRHTPNMYPRKAGTPKKVPL